MMEYEKFIKKIEGLDIDQRKNFCIEVLKEEHGFTKTNLAATFQLGAAYYYNGEFKKAKSIIEPVMLIYQKYDHIPEVNSGFNLLGAVAHYYREYELARYYYSRALKIAQEYEDEFFYAYEYNNIALSFIEQENYEKALDNILLAKENLKEQDPDMGAYVYANMALIYQGLNQIDEALHAYEYGLDVYHGHDIIPYEYLAYGILIFYKSKNISKYEGLKKEGLSCLDTMLEKHCIDVCKSLFYCGMDSDDDSLVCRVLSFMDQYQKKHTKDIKAGFIVEDFRYLYAQKKKNMENMLQALLNQKAYQKKIDQENLLQRTQEMDQYYSMSEDLQKASIRADKANQIKTQFLSNMSHDMRTPINGIMGMLLMIEKYRKDDQKVNDCLSKINASSQHLLSLVNDVLDMNKLEVNQKDVEFEPFNLNEICMQVSQIVKSQAIKEGLHIFEEYPNITNVNLLGSATDLKKILINLFTNSIKYNKPNGAIYTSIKEISHTKQNVTYEFMIRDTGIGMSQEFIDTQLYEPFVQGRNAARSKYEGTGLGMSIVKGLVDKMHGTIEVESQLNVGTCFKVILTFDLDLQTRKEDIKNQKRDLTNVKILVVEDNALNMEVAQFLLEDLHASVYMAMNGKEAIQAFKNHKVDMILMDLMMPEMNGYEATKKIRELDSNIPILAMSANAYSEDVKKCLDVGMNAHISKPLNKDILYQTIFKYI